MDTEYIKEVLKDDIERLGCKVWGLELFGRRSNQTLRIYIDRNEGISVEDCEKVSKHVSKVLVLYLRACLPSHNPLQIYLHFYRYIYVKFG